MPPKFAVKADVDYRQGWGHQPKLTFFAAMSASPSKADIGPDMAHVCFGPSVRIVAGIGAQWSHSFRPLPPAYRSP
jgi:hypothetical protein